MDRIVEEHLSTADFAASGQGAGRAREEEGGGPLLPQDFAQDLRGRWDRIQTSFVDEPRTAVQQADELVATVMKRLAESFSEQRTNLESQWGRGDNVSTEDLRLALRKYRAFFQKLLTV